MNYLITKTGKEIACEHGMTHLQICRSILHITLRNFLGKIERGIRVKLYQEEAAIEGYAYPNKQQTKKINAILRANDIFRLTTSFRGGYNIRNSFTRPIRRLK